MCKGNRMQEMTKDIPLRETHCTPSSGSKVHLVQTAWKRYSIFPLVSHCSDSQAEAIWTHLLKSPPSPPPSVFPTQTATSHQFAREWLFSAFEAFSSMQVFLPSCCDRPKIQADILFPTPEHMQRGRPRREPLRAPAETP